MGHPTTAIVVVAFVEWLIMPSQDSFAFIEVVNSGMMRGSWSAWRKPLTFVRGGRKHLGGGGREGGDTSSLSALAED